MRPRTRAMLAVVVGAVLVLAAPSMASAVARLLDPPPIDAGPAATSAGTSRATVLVDRGRSLFQERCSSCHGMGGGVAHRGPSLVGVGAAAVDFYVSTGRMPLARPDIEPSRARRVIGPADTRALAAYVDGLGRPGPAVPTVVPARGDVALGRRLFADTCSGCHQIMAQGGIGPGFVAPALNQATPTQIGEAIRIGPYLMPQFNERRLDAHDVDSIARFVTTTARRPPDRGGWGIGNIGPVPEGLFAILLAGGALLVVMRIIGERNRS